MTEEPRSLTLQRRTIPPHVEAAVRTALQKLPADRFASAAEFAAALGDRAYAPQAMQASAVSGVLTTSPRSRALVGALAAAVAVFAVLAAWGWLRPAPSQPVRRFSMGLPPDQAMRQGVLGVNLAFSPDGRRMVYVGPGEGGDQLWLRERDRLDATPLTGTVGAHSPYFSPDGERIASRTLTSSCRPHRGRRSRWRRRGSARGGAGADGDSRLPGGHRPAPAARRA
jgi:serine/threonine-protein kinase